ncbi:MAG: hypothetical protein Q9M91_01410 [Candidatus Dojkabacteria bacterium]|nr:hypothetical protein [Candidatus Dojkabacteria bacterium]MDQ7020482.1 hypothetical protein [Candidatus Dojkabacteria bacterium]
MNDFLNSGSNLKSCENEPKVEGVYPYLDVNSQETLDWIYNQIDNYLEIDRIKEYVSNSIDSYTIQN